MHRTTARPVVAMLIVLSLLLLCVPAFAGGGGTIDGRPLDWLGQVSPRVDYDTISYNNGVIMASLDGEAVFLRTYVYEKNWLVIERTGIRCVNPIWDRDGVTGYVNGRLTHWVGAKSVFVNARTFKDPVRPAFSTDQIAYGGGNILVVANRTGKPCEQQINLGKLTLGSVTISPEGIYFTAAPENGKSRLYLASLTKAGYRVNLVEAIPAADQVCWGADRLYLVDKWGVSSWNYGDRGGLIRDAVISPSAAPYVLCGGDNTQVIFFDGYGNANSVGIPPNEKG